jgi:hypothetical protein
MIESSVVKYSALVTDVNLKGPMKGWEIARLVRQMDPAISHRLHDGAAAGDWASEGVPNSILLKNPLLQRSWLRRCPNCSTQARRLPVDRNSAIGTFETCSLISTPSVYGGRSEVIDSWSNDTTDLSGSSRA